MIQIITDSTSDLPPAVTEREGILVVPAQIVFGSESFRDGVELTSETFFERLTAEEALPTTALPLRSDFDAVFEMTRERGADAALCIHLGSAFSGTCNLARLMADEVRLPVTVFDSGTASLAMGWIAIVVARAVRGGATLDELVALAEHLRLRAALYAMLDTLEYLRRGGAPTGSSRSSPGSWKSSRFCAWRTIRSSSSGAWVRARAPSSGSAIRLPPMRPFKA